MTLRRDLKSGLPIVSDLTPPIRARVNDHSARHQDGGADEIDLTGLQGTEIRLVPKASSTGAEGTIFYDSDDDHVYVGTE